MRYLGIFAAILFPFLSMIGCSDDDPVAPEAGSYTVASTTPLPATGRKAALSGDYLYIACEDSGLVVLDIADPTEPRRVGQLVLVDLAYHVTMADELALVTCSHDAALASVDVTDPTDPQLRDTLDLSTGQGERTCCRSDLALTATWDGLHVIDVSDPDSLLNLCVVAGITGGFDVRFCPNGLTGALAVATDDTALVTIDLTDPGAPVVQDRFETPDIIYGIWVESGRVYVANRHQGLRIVDISAAGQISETGHIDLSPCDARDVVVRDNRAFVASSEGANLYVVDVTDPADMAIIWSYGTTTSKGVCLGAQAIYLLQGDQLTIVQ